MIFIKVIQVAQNIQKDIPQPDKQYFFINIKNNNIVILVVRFGLSALA